MDIKALEKAAKQGDLEAVSRILAREIFEVRCKADGIVRGLQILALIVAINGIAIAVIRYLGC